jgi:hypothetical protein
VNPLGAWPAREENDADVGVILLLVFHGRAGCPNIVNEQTAAGPAAAIFLQGVRDRPAAARDSNHAAESKFLRDKSANVSISSSVSASHSIFHCDTYPLCRTNDFLTSQFPLMGVSPWNSQQIDQRRDAETEAAGVEKRSD